jgi:hypothetical protein
MEETRVWAKFSCGNICDVPWWIDADELTLCGDYDLAAGKAATNIQFSLAFYLDGLAFMKIYQSWSI